VIIKIDNKDGKLLPGMTAFVEINTLEKDDVVALENYVLQFKPDDLLRSYVVYPEDRKLAVNESFVYKFDDKTKTVNALKVKKGITNGVVTEIIDSSVSVGDKVIADFLYEGDAKPKKDKSNNMMKQGGGRRGPPM
jgi:HlyD family secretion protein